MTNIYVYNGDDFEAHLRTLPNDEAVKLATANQEGIRPTTNIYVYNGDDFVAHLRTLPNDEAVKLANQAMRGDNQRQNHPALLRNRAFSQWLVDMAECGLV